MTCAIFHPVGWQGTTFIKNTDPHLHHIMTYAYDGTQQISMILHWNVPYHEIPHDEKYGFMHRHYHLKLSLQETKELVQCLQQHIDRLEPHQCS